MGRHAESSEADVDAPIAVGAEYVSFAPTSASGGIGSDLRFGAEAAYDRGDANVGIPMTLWAGAGVGYELEHSSGSTYDETARGFEWLHVEGGEHRLSPAMSIGRFVESAARSTNG